MTIVSVDMCDLLHMSLVDDVLQVLWKVGLDEHDIKTVEHSNGWCTWPELLRVPGICEKRDYYNYGWLSNFIVLGDDWILEFDRNEQDEYYNKWVFACVRPSADKHVVPELSMLISSA